MLADYAQQIVREIVGTAHLNPDALDPRTARVAIRMRGTIVPCLSCGDDRPAAQLSVGTALCPACRLPSDADTNTTEVTS